MIKSELVQKISNNLQNIPIAKINSGVNLILQKIINNLQNGGRVELRGFGVFSLRRYKARIAYNPKRRVKVKIGCKNQVHFKPGKELKDRVNAGRL